jgi:hypothetical protein
MLSCDKTNLNTGENVDDSQEVILESSSEVTNEYIYYYGSSSSPIVDFDGELNDTTKHYFVEVFPDSSTIGAGDLYKIRIFDNYSEYLDYGDSIGLEATLHHEAYSLIGEYGLENNVDSFYLLNDSFPDHFIEYRDSILQAYLGFDNYSSSKSRNWSAELKDKNFCDSGPTLFTLPYVGLPNLWILGWRNRISSFRGVGVAGLHMVFRKRFYFGHMYTFHVWGFSCIDFGGPLIYLNNNSNSWVNTPIGL